MTAKIYLVISGKGGVGKTTVFANLATSLAMVGKKIAVFTAIENKSLRDRFQKGQEEFLKMVAEAGGISAVQRETFEDLATEFQWVSDINWCNSQ